MTTVMEAVKLAIAREGAIRFEVQARPRASVTRITAVRGGAIVVRIAAAPVDRAANDELLKTLAHALSIARRQVEIVRGETSRSKLVEVRGLGDDEVRDRLMAAIR